MVLVFVCCALIFCGGVSGRFSSPDRRCRSFVYELRRVLLSRKSEGVSHCVEGVMCGHLAFFEIVWRKQLAFLGLKSCVWLGVLSVVHSDTV